MWLRAVLWSLCFGSVVVNAVSAETSETFPFEDVKHPRTLTKSECNTLHNAVWAEARWQENGSSSVQDKSAEGCIRYFTSDNVAGAETALIFIPGDVLSDRRTDKQNYEKNANSAAQAAIAQRMSRSIGLPVIRLGRPGVYGSTGMLHMKRRTEIEAQLVNAAVTAIKERHRFARIQLAGLSGGGGLVGALLTLGRNDIDCAVVGSGATSIKSRLRDFNPARYAAGVDQTGIRLSEVYDPIDHVASVRPDTGRRIFIVGDPRDSTVSFASQREFQAKLAEAGIPATVVEASAKDEKHHRVGDQAQHIAAWCKAGLSDDQIRSKLSGTGDQAQR